MFHSTTFRALPRINDPNWSPNGCYGRSILGLQHSKKADLAIVQCLLRRNYFSLEVSSVSVSHEMVDTDFSGFENRLMSRSGNDSFIWPDANRNRSFSWLGKHYIILFWERATDWFFEQISTGKAWSQLEYHAASAVCGAAMKRVVKRAW